MVVNQSAGRRKFTAGAVVFFGQPEKLYRKSMQFHLPLQFFLPFFVRPSAGKILSRETVISSGPPPSPH